jgi:hypothetical protein
MDLRRAFLALALFATLAPSASFAEVELGRATRGYTYLNRPGASMEGHQSEMVECISEAMAVRLAGAAPVEGLIPDLLNARALASVTSSAIENCMVVRGWRVVRVAEEEGQHLAALPRIDLAAQLEQWVGSASPPGEIVRTWNNDAWRGDTDRTDPRPTRTPNGSLSVLTVDAAALRARAVETAPVAGRRLRSIDVEDLGSLPTDSAVMIIQLLNPSIEGGTVLRFRSVSDDETALPGQDSEIVLEVPLTRNRRDGNWRAYAVPPGTWRLDGMGTLSILNFCLGAPAFEVNAGELVYAGAFDMSAATLGPDLSLDASRAWLANSTTAERVQAAEYSNGWTGTCGDNAIYAIEFEGAPFRPGYAWGSAVHRAEGTPSLPTE